jgi:outer membrane protein TolC
MMIRRACITSFLLALGVLAFGLRVSGFAESKQPVAGDSNLKDATTEIAKQQVAVAKKALSTIEQLQSAGALGKLDESFDIWQRRLIESLNKGGGNEAEYIDALKKHVEHAKLNLKATEALFKDNKVSQTQLCDAQYQALDAQAWLAESLTK